MANDVVLSAALRQNLLSLQTTQASTDKVQNILATGLKVSSALDNPQNFFAAQSLKNRSSDLGKLLDGIGQSVQTIKTADKGVSALTKLVEQADSIVDQAREAVTEGGKEAVLLGDKDLSGLADLTDLSGIANGDKLIFSVIGDGNSITNASVTIATDDSIEQIITKINDIQNSAGDALLKAEINSDGQLKITNLDGVKAYTLTFDASSGTAGGVEDQALAESLGFGSLAKVTGAPTSTTVAGNAVEVTAVSSTKLVSGSFYKSSSTDFASASDTLVSVQRAASSSSANRFAIGSTSVTSAVAALALQVKVNDDTTVSIAIASTTTIQGLVDSINNNTSLNTQIEASYDATTGKFSIEAVDAAVQTVQIGAKNATASGTSGNNAVTGQAMDFDFGVDQLYQSTAATFATTATVSTSMQEGETFRLASAASTLSQLETDYNNVLDQIDTLVGDAGYRGVNLLGGDTMTTYFNEGRTSKLDVTGQDLTASGMGLSAANFSRESTINEIGTSTKAALTSVRTFSSTLSNSLSIIQTREDFTKDLISNLDEGADKLTLADQNEEGAKLLALQTRQQLGIQALSLASQAQQSVLRLF